MAAYVSDSDLALADGASRSCCRRTSPRSSGGDLGADPRGRLGDRRPRVRRRPRHRTARELSIDAVDPLRRAAARRRGARPSSSPRMALDASPSSRPCTAPSSPSCSTSPTSCVTAEAADLGAADTTPDNLYMLGTFRLRPRRGARHRHRPRPPPATGASRSRTSGTSASSRARRRSSLTNAAAVADDDGTVRVVVAATDPGAGQLARHRRPPPRLRHPALARQPRPRPPSRQGRRSGRGAMTGVERLDRDRLVDEACEPAARRGRLRRGRPGRTGSTGCSTRCATRPGCNELGVEIAAGEIVGYLANRLRHHGLARATTRTVAERRRSTGPIVIVGQPRTGHDDPLRPARPGPGPPRAADLGGRPPVPAAGDRDLRRPTRASTRCRPPSTWPSQLIPGFTTFHPMGARLGAGVRAHHRRRLPQHDLPDAVPACPTTTAGCSTRPTGARLPMAPHLPAAPAVRRAGGQWLLKSPAHLWHLDDPGRRVPRRGDRADPPRPAQRDRVGQRARRTTCAGWPATRATWPRARRSTARTSSSGSTGGWRARQAADGSRSSTCSSPSSWPTRWRPSATHLRRARPRAAARRRGADARLPGRAPGRRRRRPLPFADTGLDAGELRERMRAYQERLRSADRGTQVVAHPRRRRARSARPGQASSCAGRGCPPTPGHLAGQDHVRLALGGRADGGRGRCRRSPRGRRSTRWRLGQPEVQRSRTSCRVR